MFEISVLIYFFYLTLWKSEQMKKTKKIFFKFHFPREISWAVQNVLQAACDCIKP